MRARQVDLVVPLGNLGSCSRPFLAATPVVLSEKSSREFDRGRRLHLLVCTGHRQPQDDVRSANNLPDFLCPVNRSNDVRRTENEEGLWMSFILPLAP